MTAAVRGTKVLHKVAQRLEGLSALCVVEAGAYAAKLLMALQVQQALLLGRSNKMLLKLRCR